MLTLSDDNTRLTVEGEYNRSGNIVTVFLSCKCGGVFALHKMKTGTL